MIDFSYEMIKGVFDSIGTTGSFKWANYSVKFLAIAFFLLNIYGSFLDNISKDWGSVSLPFNFSKLVSSFMIIVVIIGFDSFLIWIENIFLPLDNQINTYNPIIGELIELVPEEEEAGDTEKGWADTLVNGVESFQLIIKTPYFLLSKLFYFVLWLVDNIVYGIFLVERFFALTVLRLIAPFVFALSVFEKFRDLFFKWIKIYAGFYLLILPFFLVIYVTNEIYFNISKGIISDTPVGSNLTGAALVGSAVAVSISLWLKLRLFKKSTSILMRILGNG